MRSEARDLYRRVAKPKQRVATLEHIQEGYVYADGAQRRLYDPADVGSAQAVLLRQCVQWSLGPLVIGGCLGTDPLGVELRVGLVGVELVSCTLTAANPSCTVGGAVEGMRTELTVTLTTSRFAITITGSLCAPAAGCRSFNVTVPIGI